MKVDARKVQMVGYSTLSVSLPKDWVKQAGIKPGDIVSMIRLEDGSLKIKPGLVKEESEKISKTVYVDTCEDSGLLGRMVIALYLTGADTVTLVSNQGLSRERVDEVKGAVERLNGFSIVEESPNKMVIQSFIDPASSPIWNLMRRLHSLTGHMLELLQKALKDGDAEPLRDVEEAEEEADRVYWLSVRQLILANIRPELQEKLGVDNPKYIPGHRMVVKLLEKVGDFIEMASKDLESMMKGDVKLRDADMGLLAKYTEEAASIYNEAFDSWAAKNPFKANSIVDSSSYLERELRKASVDIGNKYSGSGDKSGVSLALSVKSYLDNLAQVVNFSGTIAEAAINHSAIEPPTLKCKIE
ncbi:MAG: AbrB/MazE/SpoVT family DNA-binding domain-containing protein [Conexivisphaera sp.]|jgi:phosphate uptake regulator